MSKELKLWNGNIDIPRDDERRVVRGNGSCSGHAYVCAYSVKDLISIVHEYNKHDMITPYMVNTYWSDGCWGNPMDGIEPARGMWIQFKEFSKEVPTKVV